MYTTSDVRQRYFIKPKENYEKMGTRVKQALCMCLIFSVDIIKRVLLFFFFVCLMPRRAWLWEMKGQPWQTSADGNRQRSFSFLFFFFYSFTSRVAVRHPTSKNIRRIIKKKIGKRGSILLTNSSSDRISYTALYRGGGEIKNQHK